MIGSILCLALSVQTAHCVLARAGSGLIRLS